MSDGSNTNYGSGIIDSLYGRTLRTVGAEIARPDIARLVSVFEYGVLYELLIGFMFVSSAFCFTYCYVRQTELASSLDNVWAHYRIVIDCVIN